MLSGNSAGAGQRQRSGRRRPRYCRIFAMMISTEDIVLRDVAESDLAILFEQQRDPEANWMAAFVSRDPSDRDAFLKHWMRILADPTVTMMAVIRDGRVVGSVGSFVMEG